MESILSSVNPYFVLLVTATVTLGTSLGFAVLIYDVVSVITPNLIAIIVGLLFSIVWAVAMLGACQIDYQIKQLREARV